MNHHDCSDHNHGDDDFWGAAETPPYTYTLRVIDFVGIGLTGLSMVVAGVAQGVHYVLQLSAKECFMAATGQRQRAHERAERRRLERYAATFDAKELEP